MTKSNPVRLAILVGSARVHGDGNRIALWAHNHLLDLLKNRPLSTVNIFTPDTHPLPLGPLVDSTLPRNLVSAHKMNGIELYPYQSTRAQAFSRTVQALDGVIVVSPQYNGSYPGDLKSTIDHLYHEWKDLPFGVVTYGEQGGSQAAQDLGRLLNGVEAKVVSMGKVKITLPWTPYMSSEQLSTLLEEKHLAEYEKTLKEELNKVIEAAGEYRKQKDKEIA